MDPKQQLNKLDPKLQKAYNRVMGTQIPSPTPPQPTPPAEPTKPTPLPPTTPVPPTPPPIPTPPPSIPQQQVAPPPPPPQDSMAATIAVAPAPAASNATGPTGFVAQQAESKKRISPIILITGLIVFFVVYSLVWVRVFNLQLPFLPQ